MNVINFKQSTPSTQWVIVHNFGHKPVVDAWVMLNGTLQKINAMAVDHIDNNTLHIKFSSAQTGGARVIGEKI